jgi:hypothetical protein
MIADARSRVTGWFDDRRAGSANDAAAARGVDVSAQLASLADLHTRGELTDEEYASAKARLLSG